MARRGRAYLRMYSEVYGTHLRAYLKALRNVDEWARAEQSPADGP